MKVYEKMNELVGATASKDSIANWAYMNRVLVMMVGEEEEFEELKETVDQFIEDVDYHGMADEHEAWRLFLDYEVVENKEVRDINRHEEG